MRTWRGCVVAQHGVRCSPFYRPNLNRTNTSAHQWHGLGTSTIISFEPRGARPARFSPRRVSADHPRSTCRAVRTWRGCVVGQRRALASPRRRPGLNRINTATGRQRGVFKTVITALETPGAWPAHFSPRGLSTDRPRSTSRAVRTWSGCGVGQRRALSPPRRRPGTIAPTPRQVGSAEFGKAVITGLESRGARPSRCAPWSIGRPPMEYTPRSADLAWLCCGPTQGALVPTSSAGAQSCEHRDRLVARRS